MPNDAHFRTATPADLDRCADICLHAFTQFNARHGFPPDFPTRDAAAGLIAMCLNTPQVYGVVAERSGRVVGSNFLWETGMIAGIGPITVDPDEQSQALGRGLMQTVLARARERGFAGVRLCQAAFNTRSMSLYTKLGFDVREPLVCINGKPIGKTIEGHGARAVTGRDLDACDDVCRRVHGHDRRAELEAALSRGSATLIERGGRVVAYATDIGFFGHAVALDNPALMSLIGAAGEFTGPGFLLPSRNGEVFRWCLANELRMVQPMTLMSLGLYNEPRGAFMPSVLF